MKTNLVKFLVLATLAILLLGSCASGHRSCEAYADSHYKGGIFASARW